MRVCVSARGFNVQAVDIHMSTRFLSALGGLFDELIDVPVPVKQLRQLIGRLD
jgi:hypothetical protein